MPAPLTRILDEAETMLGANLEAERSAEAPGWLQEMDPRAKVAGLFLAIFASSLAHQPATLALMYLTLVIVGASSRLGVWPMLRREWAVVGFFTGMLALPALILTPGDPVMRLPGGLAVTGSGLEAGSRLMLRALASVRAAMLLTHSTCWTDVLRGLRGLGVPSLAVLLVSLCHRYIVLLLDKARDMLTGREARRVGRVPGSIARGQAAGIAGALLLRSWDTGEAVYSAMAARGYRGDLPALSPLRFTARDARFFLFSLVVLAGMVLVDRIAFPL